MNKVKDIQEVDNSAPFKKMVHLLYVPTMFCNLGCKYCYLGSQTDQKSLVKEEHKAVEALDFALKKFLKADVLPFNVSLHGGEVTTLRQTTLKALYKLIEQHYLNHFDHLTANGFKKVNPHIKTNLYNFDKLHGLMLEHKVSISASIDLPLSLHEKYRTTKKDQSTLAKTLNNLKLLGQYPHGKKISATLYQEHFDKCDELIQDIWYIHNELKFDMNQFNFMFGFNSALNDDKFNDNLLDTTPISHEGQVAFYHKMKESFTGTELEYGFKRNWFDEFTPSYCTNAFNCGERFFLLQADGNIYSCVRGQGVEPFFYGNIFHDSVEDILNAGKQKIAKVHQEQELHEDCQKCEYLHICHTGCPFVKNESRSGKSYTCLLQKEIYKDNPIAYPPAKNTEHQKLLLEDYTFRMHPHKLSAKPEKKISFEVPTELTEANNHLKSIIEGDTILESLYAEDAFFFDLDGDIYPLASQILKVKREFYNLCPEDSIRIHIKKSIFEVNCKEKIRNTFYIQMLRDTKVVYGDEKRTKQEHLFTHQIFYNLLKESTVLGSEYFEFNLGKLLRSSQEYFIENVPNNIFFTTLTLRDYHYQKQKQNAFYHIQAINLPFQNIEFFWNE
ncbi:SPASM domain-containing protein [Rapidithrix thailandica]|uniref:SPASM domain-containing protein n=1 Tax=Rapidithrix thailandica TaxID=413964 RepID=A0AAW9RR45_9BACT